MKEKRQLNRLQINKAQNVTLQFEVAKSQSVTFEVLDITPLGCLICGQGSLIETEILQTRLFFNQHLMGQYEKVQIRGHQQRDNKNFYNIKFSSEKKKQGSQRADRYNSSESIRPTGYFYNPNIFNSIIHFSITNISRGGLRISISSSNKMIFCSEQVIELNIQFPCSQKKSSLEGKIRNIHPENNGTLLVLGFEIIKESNFYEEASRYFLTFCHHKETKAIFLDRYADVKNLKNAFTYSLCDRQEELNGLLEVRYESYSDANKSGLKESPIEFYDKYDDYSIHVIAKLGKKVIASVRLIQRGKDKNSFELDDYVKLPDYLESEKTVEISRASVDPRFQKTNVVHGLFEYLTLLCLQMNVDYLVTSAEAKQVKIYKYLGFKKTSIKYELSSLGSRTHFVLVGDMDTVKSMKKINPIYWYFSYSRVSTYLDKYGLLSLNKVSWIKKLGIKLIKIIKKLRSI